MQPPEGTVAIAFTELIGAAAAWERLGPAFRPAFEAAEALMRPALDAAEGYEVKAEGAGMMLAFPEPAAALRFGQAALSALAEAALPGAAGPLALRVGVCLGEVIARPDPTTGRVDYLGPTVNKAARITAAARAGQLLLCERAAMAAGQPVTLAAELPLRGLSGRHRLYRLGADEERAADRLFGRETELAALGALIADGARLLTLHGPGGVGKSRLARELAWSAPGLDRVWWCALGEVRDLDGVNRAVGRALDLPLGPRPAEQIGAALAGRGRGLLVLDGMEHLISEATYTVSSWHRAAPQLTILITSRAPLGDRAERLVPVHPLNPEAAVALFLDRAGGAAPREQVAALVARLDHLPLAIELAAARAGDRPLDEILADQDGAARRGLRATLDWSWALLEPDERRALAQLTAFEGGFTLEAAEEVLRTDGWPPDLLSRLVDHSLLRYDPAQGRYSALLSVVEYVSAQEPEERAGACLRHAAFFAQLGRVGAPGALEVLEGQAQTARALAEGPNVAAAARRAFEDPGGLPLDLADRAALRLARGRLRQLEGAEAGALPDLEAAVALFSEGGHDGAALVAMICLAEARVRVGQDGEPAARAALALARARGQPSQQAAALQVLALVHRGHGARVQAVQALKEALALPAGPHARRSRLLLALLALESGDLEGAIAGYQSLIQDVANLDAHAETLATGNLGYALLDLGRLDEAAEALSRAAALAEGLGDRRAAAMAAMNLGIVQDLSGDPSEAERWLTRAHGALRALGLEVDEATVLINLGALYGRSGRESLAISALEAAAAQLGRLGIPRARGGALHELAQVRLDLGELTSAEEAADEAVNLLRQADGGVELGMALARRARVQRRLGRIQAAEADLREARALAEAAHLRPGAALSRLLAEPEA